MILHITTHLSKKKTLQKRSIDRKDSRRHLCIQVLLHLPTQPWTQLACDIYSVNVHQSCWWEINIARKKTKIYANIQLASFNTVALQSEVTVVLKYMHVLQHVSTLTSSICCVNISNEPFKIVWLYMFSKIISKCVKSTVF